MHWPECVCVCVYVNSLGLRLSFVARICHNAAFQLLARRLASLSVRMWEIPGIAPPTSCPQKQLLSQMRGDAEELHLIQTQGDSAAASFTQERTDSSGATAEVLSCGLWGHGQLSFGLSGRRDKEIDDIHPCIHQTWLAACAAEGNAEQTEGNFPTSHQRFAI